MPICCMMKEKVNRIQMYDTWGFINKITSYKRNIYDITGSRKFGEEI